MTESSYMSDIAVKSFFEDYGILSGMKVYLRRIGDLRKKAGITQKTLAELSLVDRTTISEYENGGGNPTLGTLVAILEACGSSLAELFESKVADTYKDLKHQELHEMLQECLDQGGPTEVAATRLINGLFLTIDDDTDYL